jgi:transmembrane sensor
VLVFDVYNALMTSQPNNPSEVSDLSQRRISQQAADWFAKLRNGQVTEEERQHFQRWLTTDLAHSKAFEEIQAFWDDPALSKSLKAIPLSSQGKRHSRFSSLHYRLAVPLTAAGLILAAVILQPYLNCLQADYCTGVGESRSIQLADGSTITLNSQSAVKVNFQGNTRQIHLLQGEVLFEVKRNTAKPFLVDAQFSQTRVLGTRFIVREDRHSDTITVINGVVAVSQNQQQPAILHVNDQLTVGEATGRIHQVSATKASAWTSGHLVFDSANLGVVIKEISRYRNGTVIIKNSRLKALKVSGRFDIRNPDKALQALEQTLPIKMYRLTPWLVVII